MSERLFGTLDVARQQTLTGLLGEARPLQSAAALRKPRGTVARDSRLFSQAGFEFGRQNKRFRVRRPSGKHLVKLLALVENRSSGFRCEGPVRRSFRLAH
jgi:hypothetical protein